MASTSDAAAIATAAAAVVAVVVVVDDGDSDGDGDNDDDDDDDDDDKVEDDEEEIEEASWLTIKCGRGMEAHEGAQLLDQSSEAADSKAEFEMRPKLETGSGLYTGDLSN